MAVVELSYFQSEILHLDIVMIDHVLPEVVFIDEPILLLPVTAEGQSVTF